MCAQFIDVQQLFISNNLRLPELNILVPDTNLYEVLAIQPTGAVDVRNDFVGHSDGESALAKFNSFLQLAVARNCDLVVTPEYSCPWEVMGQAIVGNKLPKQGKIWLLACEAITPQRLQEFISTHRQVFWMHEPIPTGAGHFLGVLAYVTKAEDNAGVVKDVVVLQFKTEPMGGNTFERDHLLRGQTIYTWRNPQDNIRLVTLLCSDALAFDGNTNNHCRFDLHPHFIFHPQLNPDPRHAGFSRYRDALFDRDISKRVEVLTLNWARGFSIPGILGRSTYGGSTLYTKSEKFEFSDARIVANHERGMYFCYWHAHRTQMCLLNYEEHVFHFRMPKVFQDAAAVLVRRTGPEMLALYKWKPETRSWIDEERANDGFHNLCASFDNTQCDYCTDTTHNAVDRERLLMLTCGNLPVLAPEKKWHQVDNLDSFRAERDERCKRLTFTHEMAVDSVNYRQKHLEYFITLQSEILANPENFPPILRDLRDNYQLRPPRHDDWLPQPPRSHHGFRYNLVSRSGQNQGATVIFIGLVPFADVRQLRDNIVRAWGIAQTRRLVIWYKVPNGYRYLEPPPPTHNDDEELPDSYLRSSSL